MSKIRLHVSRQDFEAPLESRGTRRPPLTPVRKSATAQMEVDNELSWNILWTPRFLCFVDLQGSVNTQNCRIWERENPFQMQQLPLHSRKVTVWCGFTAAFIVGPFFF
ncbi:hypothetical protein AVEN_69354-1 [Araneus ventricosus]|uniref:Uncharacterized protein n=1 Tax=Araneus ventricosus TaxID=182803 RepID=A0A4Y2JZ19_ARAVE|nr:hypothetical protein AVEN_69354-1 [Araneus ventricosus]